jgi:hypothetical protein
MTETKHTPAPWVMQNYGIKGEVFSFADTGGLVVARMGKGRLRQTQNSSPLRLICLICLLT